MQPQRRPAWRPGARRRASLLLLLLLYMLPRSAADEPAKTSPQHQPASTPVGLAVTAAVQAGNSSQPSAAATTTTTATGAASASAPSANGLTRRTPHVYRIRHLAPANGRLSAPVTWLKRQTSAALEATGAGVTVGLASELPCAEEAARAHEPASLDIETRPLAVDVKSRPQAYHHQQHQQQHNHQQQQQANHRPINTAAAEQEPIVGADTSTHLASARLSDEQFDSKMFTNKSAAHLSCDSGEMILRLNFSAPFKGIVYPDNNRLSPCRFFGDGHLNYELRLPLRGCGTRQASARVFVNDVIVRFHKSLELEEDEVKTLVCRYPAPQLAQATPDAAARPDVDVVTPEVEDSAAVLNGNSFELVDRATGERLAGAAERPLSGDSNVDTLSDNLVVSPLSTFRLNGYNRAANGSSRHQFLSNLQNTNSQEPSTLANLNLRDPISRLSSQPSSASSASPNTRFGNAGILGAGGLSTLAELDVSLNGANSDFANQPTTSGSPSNIFDRLSSVELLFLISSIIFLVMLSLALAIGYYCVRRGSGGPGAGARRAIAGKSSRANKNRRFAFYDQPPSARLASAMLASNQSQPHYRLHDNPMLAAYHSRPYSSAYGYGAASGLAAGGQPAPPHLQHVQSPPSASSPESDQSATRGLLVTGRRLHNDYGRQRLYAPAPGASTLRHAGPTPTPYANPAHTILGRRHKHARAAYGARDVWRARSMSARGRGPVEGPTDGYMAQQKAGVGSLARDAHRRQRQATECDLSCTHGDQYLSNQFMAEATRRKGSKSDTNNNNNNNNNIINNNNNNSINFDRLELSHDYIPCEPALNLKARNKPATLVLKSIEDSYISNFTEITEQEYKVSDSRKFVPLPGWPARESDRTSGRKPPPPPSKADQHSSQQRSSDDQSLESMQAPMRSLTELDVNYAKTLLPSRLTGGRQVSMSVDHLAGTEPATTSTQTQQASSSASPEPALDAGPSVDYNDDQAIASRTPQAGPGKLIELTPDLMVSAEYEQGARLQLQREESGPAHNSVSYV